MSRERFTGKNKNQSRSPLWDLQQTLLWAQSPADATRIVMSVTLFPILVVCSATLYFFLASQGGFYLLSFAKVLRNMPTAQFLELRKAIDHVIENRLKILYPATIACMVVMTLMTVNIGSIINRGLLVMSILLLLLDVILALRVSIPLNTVIQHISDGSEARDIQTRWLRFIGIRAYLSVTGFVSLMTDLFISG
jgi:hypothetical protein